MNNEKKPVVIEAKQLQEVGPLKAMPLDRSGWYQHFLTFPMVDIDRNDSIVVLGTPQVAFIPRRLVVASDVAERLSVVDIKVGKNSMFLNGDGGAPGEAFPPMPSDEVDLETMKRMESMLMMYADVVQVGWHVAIHIRNMTNKTLEDVRLMMWGLIPGDM